MAAIAQMNIMRITNPYTHNGRIANPAERVYRILKTRILILLFLFVAQGIEGNEADSLLIRYSDWNIGPSHISTCSNFEVLNGYEEEFIIPTSSHVDSLKKLLTHLQEQEDRYFPIRCKLYIFCGDAVREKICMNKSTIAYKGKTYANNDTIVCFINQLMHNFPSCNSKRFLPDIIGANYVEGRDSLYRLLTKELDKWASTYFYRGTTIMTIRCKANKNGKTTNADVKIRKPEHPNKAERKMAEKLRHYMISHIRWEEDPDRSPYDFIIFTIRYDNKQ